MTRPLAIAIEAREDGPAIVIEATVASAQDALTFGAIWNAMVGAVFPDAMQDDGPEVSAETDEEPEEPAGDAPLPTRQHQSRPQAQVADGHARIGRREGARLLAARRRRPGGDRRRTRHDHLDRRDAQRPLDQGRALAPGRG